MAILQRAKIERLLHEYLFRRVRQVFLAAHDMSYFHQFVVNRRGEIIKRFIKTFRDYYIAGKRGVELYLAANKVIKFNFCFRSVKSYDGRFSIASSFFTFFQRQTAATAHVFRRHAFNQHCLAVGFKLLF